MPRGERYQRVADRTSLLAPIFDGLRGKLLLVRPDRYIVGVFSVEEEARFAESYRDILGLGPGSSKLASLPIIESRSPR